MNDNLCRFEPTFTLNGIPILPGRCQAPIAQGKAEAPVAVTHLAAARSQKTEGVILGIRMKRAALAGCLLHMERRRRLAERLYIQNRRRRERRRRQLARCAMAALFLLGCALLLFLLGRTVMRIAYPKRQATKEDILLQEAGNLAWLLMDTAQSPDADRLLDRLHRMDAGPRDCPTRKQAKTILSFFDDEASTAFLAFLEDEQEDSADASRWYQWFDSVRPLYDKTGRIQDLTVTVLAVGEQATDGAGEPLGERMVLTREGVYSYHTDRIAAQEMRFQEAVTIARGTELFSVRSFQAADLTWRNVWIQSADQTSADCFWEGYRIIVPVSEGEKISDQVADIRFLDGRVANLSLKQETVTGKLLRVTSDGAEIEGYGFFPFSEDVKLYRTYGILKELRKADLAIGADCTDFVIQNGRIEAAVMTVDPNGRTIRVLIRTSDYADRFHQVVELMSDGAVVTAGNETMTLKENETLSVGMDSELFAQTDRIRVTPGPSSDGIRLRNVARSCGTLPYRGQMELLRTSDGIVVINEVDLEEYLYAVLPSEMPASYPTEALKSQAVCARTYAYEKILHAGIPDYGAHLDDSVSYQVYHNLEENEASTQAVRATYGQTLFYGDEVAEAYYYSTSCGFGTDASVWQESNAEAFPYLVSQQIKDGDRYYEQEEPWFRWRYEVASLDVSQLERRLLQRQQADPRSILVQQQDGDTSSRTIPSLGKIRQIEAVLQGMGGVIKTLRITAQNATVEVCGEYNIRAVLCDGKTKVLRQDGSLVSAEGVLPSAFFTITPSFQDGYVTGYTLSGGGFGHGVGLSQNGARQMALSGMTQEEILAFFYRGCEIRNIDQ